MRTPFVCVAPLEEEARHPPHWGTVLSRNESAATTDADGPHALKAEGFSLAPTVVQSDAKSLVPREPAAISIYRDAANAANAAKSLPLPQRTSPVAPRDDAMSE